MVGRVNWTCVLIVVWAPLQQQHLQQQQHPAQLQGSQTGTAHLQSSQQGPPHQQQSHQQLSAAPQVQQVPSHQQSQQQHAPHPPQQFGGPAGNVSLAFSSGLSVGAGDSGSGGRGSSSEAGGMGLNVRPLQSAKAAGGGSNAGTTGGGGQRGNGGAGAGPAFLQQQFGASVAAASGGQQSGSPRNSTPSVYGSGNAVAGAGGRASDGKSFGGEQMWWFGGLCRGRVV